MSGASVTATASTGGMLLQEPIFPDDNEFSDTVPDAGGEDAAVESSTAEEAANQSGV